MNESVTTPKPIEATWHIELNCECPECDKYVDLLEYCDFWDGNSLKIGEHGTDRSKRVCAVCPNCSKEFEVCCEY